MLNAAGISTHVQIKLCKTTQEWGKAPSIHQTWLQASHHNIAADHKTGNRIDLVGSCPYTMPTDCASPSSHPPLSPRHGTLPPLRQQPPSNRPESSICCGA